MYLFIQEIVIDLLYARDYVECWKFCRGKSVRQSFQGHYSSVEVRRSLSATEKEFDLRGVQTDERSSRAYILFSW